MHFKIVLNTGVDPAQNITEFCIQDLVSWGSGGTLSPPAESKGRTLVGVQGAKPWKILNFGVVRNRFSEHFKLRYFLKTIVNRPLN